VTTSASRRRVSGRSASGGRGREVADVFPTPVETASLVSRKDGGDTDLRDLAERQHDVLLDRVARLVQGLEQGDVMPAEQVAIRALIADLALVAASFRQRSSAVLDALDESAQQLGDAKQAAAVFGRSFDRTAT